MLFHSYFLITKKDNYESSSRMKFFILALLVASAAADRIVGGAPLTPYQVPYLVNIQRYGSLMCGGSLITSNYVLSAAHCNNNAATLIVTAGDYSLSSVDGTEQVSGVTQTIPHPGYNSNTLDDDIMLIQLSSPVTANAYVQFAELPAEHDHPAPGTMCNVYGWGNTLSVGSNYPDIPYGVTVPVVSNEECNNIYGGGISDDMVCMGYVGEGGKDSCQGDSGGPAECNGILTAIVSWGNGCADPDYPGVYTCIDHYISWINQYI